VPQTYTPRVLALIPISDANPTRRTSVVTLGLIALNLIVFFFVQPSFGEGRQAAIYFLRNAPIPCQLQDQCPPALPDRDLVSLTGSVIFSTFLHGGFLHIGGNMLFLWIFGNNVEDHLGRGRYLAFYLLGGIAAGYTQVLAHLGPCDAILGEASCTPAVGASGAVAAVMGAYFVLFPHARVNAILPIFFFFTVVQLSAWVMLGLWFLFQFLVPPESSVAWQAHVGGFVFGVLAILALGGRPQRPRAVSWRPDWR
jgi:membrane associated rhomboid family serine protease